MDKEPIKGINKAMDNANNENDMWSAKAYNFLLHYIRNNSKPFLAEDVRKLSEGIVPQPPSARAWGGIMVMAKNNNMIESVGYKKVSNPKAHGTPATLWISLINIKR